MRRIRGMRPVYPGARADYRETLAGELELGARDDIATRLGCLRFVARRAWQALWER